MLRARSLPTTGHSALQAALRKQELTPPRPPDPRPSFQPHHLQPITWHQDYISPHFTTTALFLSPARRSSRGLSPHLVSGALKLGFCHTKVTAGRQGSPCDPPTLPRSLRFGVSDELLTKRQDTSGSYTELEHPTPHDYQKKQLRRPLGTGNVISGGDPDLEQQGRESGALTASWVRECGWALLWGWELCGLWQKKPHSLTSGEREETSLSEQQGGKRIRPQKR